MYIVPMTSAFFVLCKTISKTIFPEPIGERAYVKKILISNKGAFVYGDFLKWTKSDMSKQAAFKILNEFVRDGILLTRESRSKNKLFEVNPEFVPYRMKHFNE